MNLVTVVASAPATLEGSQIVTFSIVTGIALVIGAALVILARSQGANLSFVLIPVLFTLGVVLPLASFSIVSAGGPSTPEVDVSPPPTVSEQIGYGEPAFPGAGGESR